MKQIQGKQGLVRDIGRFVKPRVREIGIPLYLYEGFEVRTVPLLEINKVMKLLLLLLI